MQLAEAKAKFIADWGRFGTNWGINRTMAQIHALLLISPDPLSADEVMEELSISRGNANMNIRELMNWNLVRKVIAPGDRKEYFAAEKDIWKVFGQIVKERKKRELEPMMKLLDQLGDVEGDKREKEVKTFTDTVQNIQRVAEQANKALDTMVKAEENWFLASLVKLFK